MYDMSKDTKKEINPKRAALIQLSEQAREFRETKIEQAGNDTEALYWSTRTLNQIMLHHLYDKKGATEFNTFNQWKEKGATVIKGEKAFLIWGQPIRPKEKTETKEKSEEEAEGSTYEYFPLCYLFSDKQVRFQEDIREGEATEGETEQEQESFETVNLDDYL